MRRAIIPTFLLALLMVASISAKSGNRPAAQNPFQDNDLARAAGQKLFLRHCAECHGQAAEGTDRAPSLRQSVKLAEPAKLQSFIKNGNLRAGMPSWSRLPNQQLSQIVAYLQTLERPCTLPLG